MKHIREVPLKTLMAAIGAAEASNGMYYIPQPHDDLLGSVIEVSLKDGTDYDPEAVRFGDSGTIALFQVDRIGHITWKNADGDNSLDFDFSARQDAPDSWSVWLLPFNGAVAPTPDHQRLLKIFNPAKDNAGGMT